MKRERWLDLLAEIGEEVRFWQRQGDTGRAALAEAEYNELADYLEFPRYGTILAGCVREEDKTA